jgi:hypothetical protein
MRSKRQTRHGRLYALSEHGFELLLAGYRKSLDVALRHHRTTFAVFIATLVATGYLFVIIPRASSRSRIPVSSSARPKRRKTSRFPTRCAASGPAPKSSAKIPPSPPLA